jgi:hypothetical protein
MTGSLDDLSFTVWPPAIDISTPANPQSFAPQFSVANTSATETVSLKHALLLVPVTTKGTNLALNTDMKPNNITSGWSFGPTTTPPHEEGNAAFELLPQDSEGAIPPEGSVAFILTGVNVNTGAGTAMLRLEAKTSAGLWTPTRPVQLTTPGTKPTITNHGITPADPQTLITLQGQAVVLSWTTTGAAYCVIEDDQGNKVIDPSTGSTNLPTSGTIADTPLQGNSQTQSTAKLGRYYNRTYHFYAFSAGATQSDDRQDSVIIQLPTISFTVSPGSITPGQSVTATWSVANVDPERGTITLTLDPADGTGTYAIAIPPTQPSGSGVVTPTPQSTTTYTLAVDDGYGATFSSTQQVTSSLQPGWQEMHGLETFTYTDPLLTTIPFPFGLVAFANRLWFWTSGLSIQPAGLWSTVDGTIWTAATLPGNLDGLIVADLGDGEKLWAFGNAPFVASSSDGINWVTSPTPPYPARFFGNYVAGDGTILVLGGLDSYYTSPQSFDDDPPDLTALADVWSTSDGRAWTLVGRTLPAPGSPVPGSLLLYAVARFGGKLQSVVNDSNMVLRSYNSSDGGKTWSAATMPAQKGVPCLLLPVGGVLLLLSIPLENELFMVMDPTGVWSASTDLSPPVAGVFWSAATYQGRLWAVCQPGSGLTIPFFRLNRVMPGITFTLTPSATAHPNRTRVGTDASATDGA